MENMRVLGNMIQKLAKEKHVATEDLGKTIHCTTNQVEQLFRGRLFLTFDQLSAVANRFQVSPDVLMDGDMDYYRETVVDCMGEFSCDENREDILNIIDDYLDLLGAIE